MIISASSGLILRRISVCFLFFICIVTNLPVQFIFCLNSSSARAGSVVAIIQYGLASGISRKCSRIRFIGFEVWPNFIKSSPFVLKSIMYKVLVSLNILKSLPTIVGDSNAYLLLFVWIDKLGASTIWDCSGFGCAWDIGVMLASP